MELEKCLSILQTRQEASHCSHDQALRLHNSGVDLTLPNDRPSNDVIASMGKYDLLSVFFSLQEERVQTYGGFDNALDTLIKNKKVAEYPILCAEITSRFTVISTKIIELKEQFRRINLEEISVNIASLQELEKDKLLLVAAHHLDVIRREMPDLLSLPNVDSDNVSGPNLRRRPPSIVAIEQRVSSILENLQAAKCEWLENDS